MVKITESRDEILDIIREASGYADNAEQVIYQLNTDQE